MLFYKVGIYAVPEGLTGFRETTEAYKMDIRKKFRRTLLPFLLSAVLALTGFTPLFVYGDEELPEEDPAPAVEVTEQEEIPAEEEEIVVLPEEETPAPQEPEVTEEPEEPVPLPAEEEETEEPEVPVVPAEVPSAFSVTDVSAPSSLVWKQDFPVRGVIHSDVPLTKVQVGVVDSTGTWITGHKYETAATDNEFDIAAANSELSLTTLAPGKYRFRVYAFDENGTKSSPLVNKALTVKHKTAKQLANGDYPLVFNTAVATDQRLSGKADPVATLTARTNGISLSWTDCKGKGADIDGYIILRRIRTAKQYTEVTRLSSATTKFRDKNALTDNCFYGYAILAYKKDKDGSVMVSKVDTVDGVTPTSRLKNPYEITLSKTSTTIQVGGSYTIKATFPENSHHSGWVRWATSNKNVATVSGGKVTGKSVGSATITARVCNGRKFYCRVHVVGALKPGKPTLSLSYGKNDATCIQWTKAAHATSYDVYYAKLNGETWSSYQKLTNTTSLSYVHKGLTKGDVYRYYVKARNDNQGYTSVGDRSNVYKKEVKLVKAKTKVSGLATAPTPKSRSVYKDTVTITAPAGRTLNVQRLESGGWKTRKTQKLPEGTGSASVTITFPSQWWYQNTSTWRIMINGNDSATYYASSKIVIKPRRYYQNPSGYYQIQSSIPTRSTSYTLYTGINGYKVWLVQKKLNAFSGDYEGYTSKTAAAVKTFQKKHGLTADGVVGINTWTALGYTSHQWYYADSYVSPIKINPASTRSQCIEAMIETAESYLGTRYVWCAAARPGEGVDCSGLVIQALYSAGIDPLPAGSHVYALPAYEKTSAILWNSTKFKHVSWANRKRGDIICYVGHVTIYLGNDTMIEALPGGVRKAPVRTNNLRGVIRPFV